MTSLEALFARAEQLSYPSIYLITVLGFGALYLASCLGALGLRALLARAGVGQSLAPSGWTGPKPGQTRHELLGSAVSMLVFGFYGVLPIALERAGLLRIHWAPRWGTLLPELLLLTLWNEVHFYFVHRLLHRPWLYRRIHAWHHLSTVPTPWSVFSFHWVEAALLGSVMVLVMPLVQLQLLAMALFPAVSLTLNQLGHWAWDVSGQRSTWHPLAASRRHALHHRAVHGNFGFLLPVFDRLLGTALPEAPR